MKEFSALIPDDRKFEVGGEVFEWVTPYWEDIASMFDDDLRDAMRVLAETENGDSTPVMAGSDTQSHDNVRKTQERIAIFLPEKDRSRWETLCQRKTDPVPIHMYAEVYKWLMEVATGRPTLPPSDSAPGGGNGAASSRAASRSRAGSRKG